MDEMSKVEGLSNRRRPPKRGDTSDALLEVAGAVFAEVGFEAASGREICERAGVNPAAINYYFGGVEELHIAVVDLAYEKTVALASVLDAVTVQASPKEKLFRLTQLMLRTSLTASEDSWAMRVLSREALRPSPHLDSLRKKKLIPKVNIVRDLVAEFMELPTDHPAVTDGCLAHLSVTTMPHMLDRGALKAVFSDMPWEGEAVNAAIDRLTQFVFAGLKQLAKDAKKKK